MKFDLLDHGYIEFIEDWGRGKVGIPEAGIIEAARQSTQGCFRGWEEDAKLLKYLYNHKHDSPFEFAGLVIEIQAPLFVFREWHRHRTQSYNEMSARYEPLPALYYHCPEDEVLRRAYEAAEAKNRQASNSAKVDPDRIHEWLEDDKFYTGALEKHYQEGLNAGVPKELARKKMPVDHYSRMRAHANLRNWLAFMTLRADPNAQWEIQQYAYSLGEIIADRFPHTWAIYKSGARK